MWYRLLCVLPTLWLLLPGMVSAKPEKPLLEYRITGLPNVINHLVYSYDGQFLAACLRGANGIRIYSTSADYPEKARDTDYHDSSYWADFDAKGRLVTSCHDGKIRIYIPPDFALLKEEETPGGKRPSGVPSPLTVIELLSDTKKTQMSMSWMVIL